jgi:methylated-DNA-[protein]-cysteine S-methyltransferase
MAQSHFYHSPIGWIKFEESEQGLSSLSFTTPPPTPQPTCSSKLLYKLEEYFNHGILTPPKLNVIGTAFQKKIWDLVKKIPKGSTKTYKEIALAYGDLKAIRAVAHAIGKNPILLFIPCHRVIGSDGSMTGYAGGIAKKKWLLAHEKASTQKTLDL